MAVIMFGPLVVGARGTAGGLIFSANKAGPYVRSWSRGSNPRSPLQSNQRGILTDFATNWRNLTQPQRDDWDTYAADPAQDLTNSLGETYSISGFNWYVRINTHLTLAGEAPRDDAPTLTRPLAPIIEKFLLRISDIAPESLTQYTVADPALADIHTNHIRVFNSEGRQVASGNLAFIVAEVPDVNRVIIYQPQPESHVGTIQLGQRGFLETRIQDAHGQRGPTDTAFADAEIA